MKHDLFDLTGKTALITGAGGLLGIEHAIALLESNSNIVLTDISLESLKNTKKILEKKFPRKIILQEKMDVSDLNSIKNTEKELSAKGIFINILINNAAIDAKVQSEGQITNSTNFEDFSQHRWDLELAVGLRGAFQCSQIFGTKMAQSKLGGVILNISSDLSVIAPDQRLYQDKESNTIQVKPVTYSVIKTGLIGLTRYLATYWAEKGIRCNALSPGGVLNNQSEKFIKKIENLIPLGRMADKDEYKSAIKFLCSNASSYMTGQNIVIDGGRSIW